MYMVYRGEGRGGGGGRTIKPLLENVLSDLGPLCDQIRRPDRSGEGGKFLGTSTLTALNFGTPGTRFFTHNT